jgi:glutamyl-tRNA reductase
MGNRQDSVHRVESIRAREVRRLLNKLSLPPEQEEAIEKLSLSLVEELVRGPIAKTVILDPTSLEEAHHVGPGS